jgi:hypothetical protein
MTGTNRHFSRATNVLQANCMASTHIRIHSPWPVSGKQFEDKIDAHNYTYPEPSALSTDAEKIKHYYF